MKYGNIEVFVVVKGRRIDEYRKDGKTYIEGRKGSNYALEVRNNSSTRVKAVLSVDGLNILTGDNNWEEGYVFNAWQSYNIPGFKIDQDKNAKFEFGSVPSSYNQHNDTGDKNNIGVIGCMVFDEEVKPIAVPNHIHHYHYDSPWKLWPNYPYPSYPYYTLGGNGISYSNNLQNYSGIIGSNLNNSVNLVQSQSSVRGMDTPTQVFACAATPEPVEQSLGTKWGDEIQFKTQEVSYDFKKVSACTMTIYYDERKGLERRGIRFDKKYKPPKAEPNAFPGYRKGCPYPTK